MSSCGPWPTPTFASTAPESGLTITNVASSLLRTSSRPPPDCAAPATMVNAAAAAVRQNVIFIAPLSITAAQQEGRKAEGQEFKASSFRPSSLHPSCLPSLNSRFPALLPSCPADYHPIACLLLIY